MAVSLTESLTYWFIRHWNSGPIAVWQRSEFLRFHTDRHRNQVLALGLA